MEELFLKFVNTGVNAGWLILTVLALRLVLKKAPKALICALWAVVGLRLLLPFTFESAVSLLPSAEVFPEEFLYAAKPEINTGFDTVDNILNPVIADVLAPEPIASANPTQINAVIFTFMWLAGTALMLVYMFVSFLRVKLRVREAALTGENIWVCDRVDTPFILGVIRPRIYLPSDIGESDAVYVIAHEKAHIKRLDYIWKPLGFLVLALHWFNPMVWLAYVIFCRDIEFACDEKVIRELGAEEKQAYSTALLNLSAPKHIISACPLAFGEVGVKARIKSVLNYKKPAFWVVLIAMVLAVAVAVGFLTSPYGGNISDKKLAEFIDAQIEEYTRNDKNGENARFWDAKILDIARFGDKVYVYMWVFYAEYSFESGVMKKMSASHLPTVITAKKAGDAYELSEYWEAEEYWIPEDGAKYSSSIRSKFPVYLWGKVFRDYSQEQAAIVQAKAEAAFKKQGIADTIEFDIDKDEENEYLTLALGPTSGMYTITLGMKEKGANSYSYDAIYYVYHGAGDFEFAVKSGNLCIKHTEKAGETHIFDVIYDGTDIFLFENGEQLDMITATP